MTTTTERLLQLAEEYDAKARALRLAAQELNGHQTARKHAGSETTLKAAIALRKTQRSDRSERSEQPKPSRVPPSTQKRIAARDRKARVIAEILKGSGPLPTTELGQAARAHGVSQLTGIAGYVKQGYLTRTGRRKGQFVYSFKAMPPSQPEEERHVGKK